MRRLRLSTLLVGSNALLVLFAVLAIAVAALRFLDRLADEQALARVSLAGAGARQAVGRSAEDVRTSALLLAERPTVLRLLREGDEAGLAAFLERFRATSGLAGSRVLVAGRPLAAAGGAASASGLRFVGTAPVAAMPEATVETALALDARFAERIARQVGLSVVLRAAVPGEGGSGAFRRGERYLFRQSFDTAGGAATIETALPRAEVARSLRRLERRFLLLALGIAALATAFGLKLGRRIADPIQALDREAARIGRGELLSPLPEIPRANDTAEVGSLASTMEEMRRRLARLTAELRRRQAEAEAVLTGIADGVFAVDRDRRIRYLNPQAAALLGMRPEDALGRFCGDVLDPQDDGGIRPCEARCPIVHARFRGRARATESLKRAGGKLAVVITSSEPAEDQQFQVIRDETAAETSRRLRDAVLANISHEFKTPLAAQLAALELLSERLEELGDEPARRLAASLERGALRLTRLIDNLLESARIEAGEDRIRRNPVALDEVVEQAAGLTAPLLERRRQRLSIELPFPLPEVVGDAERLTQVIVNLLSNAQKFAPEGSTITIGGETETEWVRLWIEDEGPGLPPGSPDDLFARFVRTPARFPGPAAGGNAPEEQGEPEETGMGLGLWIVRSIVERHGGKVAAISQERGARFSFTLPLGTAGGAP